MPKNIVICCDGTGNEFGEDNSNVVKLCQILVRGQKEQSVFYDPGVGTSPVPDVTRTFWSTLYKIKGLAFATGISANIQQGYIFLMNNYEDGDHVYLFGFSRGAYAARAIAGMVYACGLLTKDNAPMVEYAYKLYRDVHLKAALDKFKNTFSRQCKPHFIGLWDTVSSVGWAYERQNFPFTFRNPDVGIVRHAISIDERRAKFRTNKWGFPEDGQDVRQVWFVGVHSDIGGGYPEAESGLSKLALQWIVDEACHSGLLCSAAAYDEVVLGVGGQYAAPSPRATLHNSLTGAWTFLEWIPLPRWNAAKERDELYTYHSQSRSIAEGSVVHQSVIDRMRDIPDYRPQNLTKAYTVEPYSTRPTNLWP